MTMTLWQGRPIADMTREELIAVIEAMGAMQQRQALQEAHEREALRAVRVPNTTA